MKSVRTGWVPPRRRRSAVWILALAGLAAACDTDQPLQSTEPRGAVVTVSADGLARQVDVYTRRTFVGSNPCCVVRTTSLLGAVPTRLGLEIVVFPAGTREAKVIATTLDRGSVEDRASNLTAYSLSGGLPVTTAPAPDPAVPSQGVCAVTPLDYNSSTFEEWEALLSDWGGNDQVVAYCGYDQFTNPEFKIAVPNMFTATTPVASPVPTLTGGGDNPSYSPEIEWGQQPTFAFDVSKGDLIVVKAAFEGPTTPFVQGPESVGVKVDLLVGGKSVAVANLGTGSPAKEIAFEVP